MAEPIRKPTAEQQAVIAADYPNFVVTASAGAGKTFVLVERYLRHVIEQGHSPDQILTITFTRKAAAEMKTRIVNALRAAGRFDDAQIAETGPIQTIHSFCEKVLRENALAAGLDPDYEVMTGPPSSRLVLECVREAIAEHQEGGPEAEALIASLAGRRRHGEGLSPYEVLESAVQDVLHNLRGAGIDSEEFQKRYANPATLKAEWEKLILDRTPANVLEALDRNSDSPFKVRLQAAYKAAQGKLPDWLKGPNIEEAESEALTHAVGIAQLACMAWWRLQREMSTRQELDFIELERRGVLLLERSEATRNRLADQYRVVLVDEAQDLNPQQYRLLVSLKPDQVMLVGDSQQSIYGFRLADLELFENHARRTEKLELSKNHRSREGILNFVDHVFAHLWPGEYRPMNPKEIDFDDDTPTRFDGVEIWRHLTRDTDATSEYIKELLAEGVARKDIAVLVRDSAYAVDLRALLDSKDIPCRIAGGSERYYTRLEVRDLANALKALADPYDDFALLACLHSPLAGLTLDATFALGLHDKVIEQITGALPDTISDEDRTRLEAFVAWFNPLRAFADRLSAWEVLAEIFARSTYLPALARLPRGMQQLANARKLLALAARDPELGPLEFAERIREIQDMRHKEGDAPSGADDADEVTLMTIHKAKGLEFPVVIVPQTFGSLGKRSPDLLIEPRIGAVAPKYGKNGSLMHAFLAGLRKEREKEEELRVLYVALTRAKDRLCICTYAQNRGDTISKRFQPIVRDGMPGVVFREAFGVAEPADVP